MRKILMITGCIILLLMFFGCSTTPKPDDTAAGTDGTASASGSTQDANSGSASGCEHTWGQWVQQAATCEKAGKKERTCKICQFTEQKEIPKTAHKESEWIIASEAKVGVDGRKYKKCVICNKTIQETTIPAIGESHIHSEAERIFARITDCTKGGKENIICDCGKVMRTETIPPTEHAMLSKKVEATATESAYTLHYCANCDYSYKEAIEQTSTLQFQSNGDGTCKVTGLNDKTVTDLVIPQKSPAGDTVVIIGGEAFKNCKSIESVVIPNTVTRVMYDAFCNCSNLKTIEFPQNGTKDLELQYQCFAFCGIEELDLTKTAMQTVGSNAFYGCKSLKTVKLGAVTTIDKLAFTGCSKLTSLIHAGNLTTIGERAFEDCKELTELRGVNAQHNLDTVTQFSYHAFYGSGIRDIVFNKNLKGTNNAFEGCINLGTVDFSQVSSQFASFFGSKIEKLIFPGSLTRIPDNCFRGATLGSLQLPASVSEIGSSAFADATISKVTFGSGLTRIRANAFAGASATYDFSKVQLPLTIDYEAFANNSFTAFAFPKSTVSIGEGALMGCNKLKTLSIPFIGKDAKSSSTSTHCFAWLFGKSVDCWEQTSAVPSSLKTVILHGENPSTRAFLGVRITSLVVGSDITAIGNENFGSDSVLACVYYEGTQQEWKAVRLSTSNNQKLASAETYFYSATEPATDGKFWHYDANGGVVVW